MRSPVDICNMALANIGENAEISSINPSDGSMQSEVCNIFYPIARDALLEMHAWNFATREAQLSEVLDDRKDWRFCYSLPADFLKAIKLLSDGYDKKPSYTLASKSNDHIYLYTNTESPTLQYIARVEETAAFTPLFATSLSWYLSSMLAGSIIKGQEGMRVSKQCLEHAFGFFSQAASSDSIQMEREIEHKVDWLEARM